VGFIDQLTGPGRKTFTLFYHPAIKKSPVIGIIGLSQKENGHSKTGTMRLNRSCRGLSQQSV
jgi:hypothetical protein